jgi:hypothetical protein
VEGAQTTREQTTERQKVNVHDTYATFQSLPNGMFYYGPFRKRSINRMLPVFGNDPELLTNAARTLGAVETEYGDVGYRYEVLPKIAVIVALHLGDEEFPPELNMLFPRTVTDYLTLEDIAVLGGLLASKLLRSARK